MAVYSNAGAPPAAPTLSPERTWDRASIQHLLRTSDKAVIRALVQIWQRQTSQEKSKECATEQNGRGFTAPDAFCMSHYAKAAADGQTLSTDELQYCRVRLLKYTRQLLECITERQLTVLCQTTSL